MKLFAPIALCLASSVFAAPNIGQTDSFVMAEVMSSIQSAVDSFAATVSDIPNKGTNDLTTKGKALASTIKSGATRVQSSPSLPLDQALKLVPEFDKVQDRVTSVEKELFAQLPAIQAAEQCVPVRNMVEEILQSTMDCLEVALPKIPALGQPLATMKIAEVTKTLHNMKDDFAPGKC